MATQVDLMTLFFWVIVTIAVVIILVHFFCFLKNWMLDYDGESCPVKKGCSSSKKNSCSQKRECCCCESSQRCCKPKSTACRCNHTTPAIAIPIPVTDPPTDPPTVYYYQPPVNTSCGCCR